MKGFQKCCISSAVDETDNDKLWNGGKEDGNVRSEFENGDSDTDLDKYVFPWQTFFLGGGHLRLETACIRVNAEVSCDSSYTEYWLGQGGEGGWRELSACEGQD